MTFNRHELVHLAARDLDQISGVEDQLQSAQKAFEQLQTQITELLHFFSPPEGEDVPLVYVPPGGEL